MQIKDDFKIKGKFRFKVYKAGTKELLRVTDWTENLIVLNENRGLNIFLKNLCGNFTYNLEITKAKMGDDDTPPTSNDTDLGNVVVDNILIAKRTETAVNEVTFEFFISDAEMPEQTYKEFGIFCGDQLFARALISPTFTKHTGEDVTAEYIITASNS